MSRLVLAPMEGLADDVLRGVLTGDGAFDWCVTEFVRVSDTVLPRTTFRRVSPELDHGARTRSGTPVRVQLLGSDPEMMASNAARVATLDPHGIDLNFGCPAPLVNRKRGGAALLEEPDLLFRITEAVRAAVPANLPVTAKMRLGITHTDYALDCAQALASGGASELVVHGRTKQDGYRPPARWEWIARIRESVKIPVIANGEVWTVADYAAIRAATGCDDVMIGRGSVADPLLASRIRNGGTDAPSGRTEDWQRIMPMIAEFWVGVNAKVLPRHAPGRLKQWIGMMRRHYPQADTLYNEIRALPGASEVTRCLEQHGIRLDYPAVTKSLGETGVKPNRSLRRLQSRLAVPSSCQTRNARQVEER